jgi:hypothetical protein
MAAVWPATRSSFSTSGECVRDFAVSFGDFDHQQLALVVEKSAEVDGLQRVGNLCLDRNGSCRTTARTASSSNVSAPADSAIPGQSGGLGSGSGSESSGRTCWVGHSR